MDRKTSHSVCHAHWVRSHFCFLRVKFSLKSLAINHSPYYPSRYVPGIYLTLRLSGSLHFVAFTTNFIKLPVVSKGLLLILSDVPFYSIFDFMFGP